MQIRRVRHLTVAVRDIDAARDTFASLLGADAADAIDVAAFGAVTRDLALGSSTLQLASPRDRQGALQRFIERRGEGVYAVALEVDDLDAAVAELAAKGVRVSEPVEAMPGVRTAFITMAATHGVSIQLVQGAARAKEPEPEATVTTAAEPTSDPKPLDLTPDEWSDLD
jgi:methylmalonyl-CoA/ethylmalonyl-CoA epimerase